jgi:hypothetical protein
MDVSGGDEDEAAGEDEAANDTQETDRPIRGQRGVWALAVVPGDIQALRAQLRQRAGAQRPA